MPKKVLISEFFMPRRPDNARLKEFLYCLEANLQCFDEVVLLNEKVIPEGVLPLSPKLKVHVTTKRLTFSDACSYFNASYTGGDLLCLANLDISFEACNLEAASQLLGQDLGLSEKHGELNPSLPELQTQSGGAGSDGESGEFKPSETSEVDSFGAPRGKPRVLCLTRYERRGNRLDINVSESSQDSWFFTYPVKVLRCEPACTTPCTTGKRCMNFYLGLFGCDSRMAYLLALEHEVLNPVSKLISIHFHQSEDRVGCFSDLSTRQEYKVEGDQRVVPFS